VIGTPPAAHLLAIRGYAFELGEPLSAQAEQNLAAAIAMLGTRLASIGGAARARGRVPRYGGT
jgi:hypothetical protein